MLTFIVVTALVLAVTGFGVFAIPFLILGGLLWLVMLPIKLLFGFVFGVLFRIFFGVLGALLGLILAPIILVVAGIALIGAFLAGVVALLAPLVPVVLLLLLGWGIVRLVRPRVQTTGQYYTL